MTPKVNRTYEEIKTFRELLLKEFPGLAIPPLAGDSKTEVSKFFQSIWQIQDITYSDLFYQFLQLNSVDKLLNSHKHLHEAYQTKSSLLGLLWSDKRTFSNELFKEIVVRNSGTNDVERMPWADISSFNDYCENQYLCIQGSLGLIGHLLSESARLTQKVKDNMAQLEPIFSKLKLQFERLNYAKQLFPALDRSPIRLELVWEKMSNASSTLSKLISDLLRSETRGNKSAEHLRGVFKFERLAGNHRNAQARQNRLHSQSMITRLTLRCSRRKHSTNRLTQCANCK
jgi:hypothetical protein